MQDLYIWLIGGAEKSLYTLVEFWCFCRWEVHGSGGVEGLRSMSISSRLTTKQIQFCVFLYFNAHVYMSNWLSMPGDTSTSLDRCRPNFATPSTQEEKKEHNLRWSIILRTQGHR